jgi:hypothetical protein
VRISANVTDGASPVADAEVTFTVSNASGVTATRTATTDATGLAEAEFRFSTKDWGRGPIDLTANATATGYDPGSYNEPGAFSLR